MSDRPFTQVNLYTRSGNYVATVEVLPLIPPPEAVIWGVRTFIRDLNGNYIEGIAHYATEVVPTTMQQVIPPMRINP